VGKGRVAENSIAQYFHWMFVKRRKRLNARRRVMDLMEYKPKSILVTHDMPPVEEESSDKPAKKTFYYWQVPRREFENRRAKEMNP
jgi:hypothetical protein